MSPDEHIPGQADQASSEPQYEVGYCKPPVRTRFQAGSGGNRKGRRKTPELDLGAVYQDVSAELISAKLNGRPKKLSRLEGTVARPALKGNTRAARAILERAFKHGFAKKAIQKSYIDIVNPNGELGELMRVYPRVRQLRPLRKDDVKAANE
jgi:hypothetical protein